MKRVAGALAAAFVLAGLSAAAAARMADPWPQVSPASGEALEVASFSPFVPSGIGKDAPQAKARLTWYAPRGASASVRAPAVVLLHGAGGVSYARENTYAAQLASMGIGAVVVDVFGARRDLATSFVDRVIEITETMALADAYAALAWLKARPEIDAGRVALWGFSYGAMSSVFAANAAIATKFAELYGLGATRFAGHIGFYGPCITDFDEPKTTGAPVLLAWGSGDELIDAQRCEALAGQLRQGGSTVRTVVFEGAAHQWDGGWSGSRRIGRQLNGCRFRISRDLEVRSGLLGVGMSDATTRKVMLALCVGSEGYVINADETVRAKSNRLVGEFLSGVFRLPKG
ncbi:MAG: dienelactone hydrolase family protein [Reyranellaceae bacterium]